MTVAELIAALQKCQPGAQVRFFLDFNDEYPISDVSPQDANGNVLLGPDLPAECYARDYQDERG